MLSALRIAARAGVSSTAGAARNSSTLSKTERFVRPVDPANLPRGFLVSATYAGVKAAISPKLTAPGASTGTAAAKTSPKPDVALVVSATKQPAAAAATFTKNVFKAAPVLHSSKALLKGQASPEGARAKAILTNSGCANAVTGEAGLRDTIECAKTVSALLSPPSGGSGASAGQPSAETLAAANADHTLVLSTGVIGVPLPMPTLRKAFPHLAAPNILSNSPEAWHEVARAFMTTDTFPKLRARSFELAGRKCSIVGIDKGAGMIHPAMEGPRSSSSATAGLHATLLGLVATDAPISPPALQSALEHAVSRSFNCISIDGDMSTNDTIIALANGQAPGSGSGGSVKEGEEISEEAHPAEYAQFREVLTDFLKELSHLVVRDGEGAEKFVEITVKGAPTYDHAHAIASTISTSALVKCALHGGDANWGRILCAVGYAKLPPSSWTVEPSLVTVKFLPPTSADSTSFKPLLVLDNGVPQKVDEDEAGRLLGLEDIVIEVDLKGGSAGSSGARESATYWTCDFSKEYVAINGDYRS
ncbi:glutamate N-acetyltransferase [Tilletia horrida]|uniref:Arginine biosynthesis bifunctional protein ArgJ, mitochondrial n=1 Tax=Tilletia horrida TaxID=155126 RepID=A0AAN6JUE6_9BASI|nr:glutamate N-acetyltransferase [Tilletia horrida]KAK0565806.1 glutamate N-acetyltransferase [Tilletia horrida]